MNFNGHHLLPLGLYEVLASSHAPFAVSCKGWLLADCSVLTVTAFPQWLCVPFSLINPAVTDITETAYNNTLQSPWVGTLEADRAWRWIDNFLLLVRLEGFS